MIPEKNSLWKVLAVSVAGSSHLKAGIPCQDACAWKILDNGILVGAVGDGAGSAKRAEHGSSFTVQSATQFLEAHLAVQQPGSVDACKALLIDCISHTRSRLGDMVDQTCEGSNSPICLNDFATTLIIFFVTDSFLGTAQIGDGAMVYRTPQNELIVACNPEHGEYLNDTYFITSEDFDRHCQFKVESSLDVESLALFSDGIQMLALLYKDCSAHGPFFNPLFSFAAGENASVDALRVFLLSDRVCEHSDDDKTLFLAVRLSAHSQ